ncbi:MAG: hypothetical protein R2849_00770 [Thermomicrobiales bacterium]
MRQVQYYDKSRMEITDPTVDPNSIWYVTNGLLATELITGRMQLGNNRFDDRAPANVNVAGDANDPNGPTYATFTTPGCCFPAGWRCGNAASESGRPGYERSCPGE